ncbi:phosphoribosylamine--glycine ligase [Patescibacteria group bacterium]|nr:phosphoribosylamine--glycine ligase [Patescibacteria group bacterium]
MRRKVLIVGSGGRESAVAWKLSEDPTVEIYAAPGNAGMEAYATLVPIKADDVRALADFAEKNGIELMASAPDAAVALGITDEFVKRGILSCAPGKDAAQAEGSKAWFKRFLARHGIPTAPFEVFTDADAASAHIREKGAANIVIKADGLAAGKGVLLPNDEAEAEAALSAMLREGAFGDAGRTVVIEERLSGVERSVIALTDGLTAYPFPMTQDYKRIRDDDEGPNTGGMGTHTLDLSSGDEAALLAVLTDTLAAFRREGMTYRGYIYLGMMLTKRGPAVIECNCRLGDPETEVIMPSIDANLFALIEAAAKGALGTVHAPRKAREALSVVLASAGYPGTVTADVPISGIEGAHAEGALVFHAGTARRNGVFMTNGAGRVLNVVGTGGTLKEAHDRAYTALKSVSFDGMQYRTDIGKSYL